MKKFLIFLSAFLLNIGFAFSVDCSDIDCPQGWTPAETGWVVIQLDSNLSCIGKICYCYDTTNIPDVELAHFYIKKIIWADTTCYPQNYQLMDPAIFKQSLLTELTRNHMNEFPFVVCPNQSFTNRLYMTWCYASYFWDEPGTVDPHRYPVLIPCDGDGGCIQQFKYCWDTSEIPWKLIVTKYGEPIPYGQPDCFLPISPAPNYVLIHPCIPHCQ